MAIKYLLDAHALIWYLEDNTKLGNTAKVILDDPQSALILPAIAMAEALYVVAKGRTKIPNVTDLLQDVETDGRIEIYPLSVEVLRQSLQAEAVPEMHDRLIVATGLYLQSLGEQVEILTKDASIIAAALLTVVWQ